MLAEIFGVDGIIILIVVLVVLFGGAAIPKLARNLGSAKNEFEKGIKESTTPETSTTVTTTKASDEAAPTTTVSTTRTTDDAGPVTPK
jgi:TatA/E family protein of Tat protein translocase